MDEHRRRAMEPGLAVVVSVDDHGGVDDHRGWGDDDGLGWRSDHHSGRVRGRVVVGGGDGGAGDGADGQTADAPPHGILGTGLGRGSGREQHGQGSDEKGRFHRRGWELRSRVETRAVLKYSLPVMQDRESRVRS
jgi:hypothetical protein